MTIYTEFTHYANFATAAALSIVLGVITWLVLAIARTPPATVAAAGMMRDASSRAARASPYWSAPSSCVPVVLSMLAGFTGTTPSA